MLAEVAQQRAPIRVRQARCLPRDMPFGRRSSAWRHADGLTCDDRLRLSEPLRSAYADADGGHSPCDMPSRLWRSSAWRDADGSARATGPICRATGPRRLPGSGTTRCVSGRMASDLWRRVVAPETTGTAFSLRLCIYWHARRGCGRTGMLPGGSGSKWRRKCLKRRNLRKKGKSRRDVDTDFVSSARIFFELQKNEPKRLKSLSRARNRPLTLAVDRYRVRTSLLRHSQPIYFRPFESWATPRRRRDERSANVAAEQVTAEA
jgi:hypothetical protein